jgi:hypothetical protein
MNTKGEILLEQSGVVRSNCIDCLDRTNVTQVCTSSYSVIQYKLCTNFQNEFNKVHLCTSLHTSVIDPPPRVALICRPRLSAGHVI